MRAVREGLLQTVADDGHLEVRVLEPVGVVQLELGGLDVQAVIPAGDDGGNR